jgi:hypothetical protein
LKINLKFSPGSYNIEESIIKIDPKKKAEKKTSIIEHLMKVNKYQSIPSIPGKLHSFGYTENESML